jgi:hypothetical protein
VAVKCLKCAASLVSYKVWSEVGDVAVKCLKCAASIVSYKELTQITRRRIKSYKTWHSNLQRQLNMPGCCGYRENNSPFLDRNHQLCCPQTSKLLGNGGSFQEERRPSPETVH